MTTLSLWFNYSVLGNGPNATGYHVVNFLLHFFNAWLLYQLALLALKRDGAAFLAAAIWAVHPIATEAVTSIVGRADLLAAMSVLGGLLLYAKRRGPGAAATLFAVATLGVFAKENAAVLIGLMLLWELSFGEGIAGVKARWMEYAAVLASLVVLFAVRQAVLGSLPVPQPVYVDNPIRGADFVTGRLTAIKVIGLDLWLLLVPWGLSADRSFGEIALATPADVWAWLALVVVSAILTLAILRYRKDRLVFWAAGFFAIALLPTSNLLIAIGATMAERFLYLPSVGFAVVVSALLYRWNAQRARMLITLLLVLYVGRTFARNSNWNDDYALASADTVTAPRSFRLHDMLAKALFERDPKGNLDQAIAEQEKSWDILRMLPPERSSEFPPTFLGIYYSIKGDHAKSLEVLLKAREISRALEKQYDDIQKAAGRPLTTRAAFPLLYTNLANDYLNLGNVPEAIEALRYARGLSPKAMEAWEGLALAYATSGDPASAAAMMMAKGQLDGFSAGTVSALRELYGKMPDAACAFTGNGLNGQCPRVKTDLCRGSAELVQAFTEARMPADAAQSRENAVRQWGCQ